MSLKVSVVLTSYNKADYIGKAIDSILNQTFGEFELIIVDDGSSDNSLEVLKGYEEKDERVKLFAFERNRGIPSAHNFGIEHASGEYCAMIDCDDFWEQDKLQKQVDFLDQHAEYGACFSWINIVDEHEQPVASKDCEFRDVMWNSPNYTQGEWLRIFFTEGCKLSNPSMMVRRSVLQKVGMYSYGLKQLQDYDLFIRILKESNVYVIPEKLVNYRWFMGEIKNTSVDNVETSNRTNFEYYLICHDFFMGMEKEVFIDGFQQFFVQKTPTLVSVKCEQMLIYKNYFLNKDIGHAVAMDMMYHLLNEEGCRRVLEENYDIDSSYFAKELKQPILYNNRYYMDKSGNEYIAQKDRESVEIKNYWYQAEEYAKELEAKVEIINAELKKSKDYNDEMQEELLGVNNELKKSKDYNVEMQEELLGVNNELTKSKDYNAELENRILDVNSELTKLREYNTELEKRIWDVNSEFTKLREYNTELENRMLDVDAELTKSRKYSTELEGRMLEASDECNKAKSYIAELEQKVKEGYGLYEKCNAYAISLENVIHNLEDEKNKEKE